MTHIDIKHKLEIWGRAQREAAGRRKSNCKDNFGWFKFTYYIAAQQHIHVTYFFRINLTVVSKQRHFTNIRMTQTMYIIGFWKNVREIHFMLLVAEKLQVKVGPPSVTLPCSAD